MGAFYLSKQQQNSTGMETRWEQLDTATKLKVANKLTNAHLRVAPNSPAMASPSLRPGSATLPRVIARAHPELPFCGAAHLALRVSPAQRPLGRLRVRCSSGDGNDRVDKAGAGKSWVSPDWLTSIVRLGKGPDTSGIPVADAKLEDVQDLLGGALFLPLFKWMMESGPVYRLAAGPRNFVIIGDPAVAKHVLKGYGTKYAKGLVAEVSEFLFGSGFAIAEDQCWTVCYLRSCSNSSHCINFELSV